MTWLCRRAGGLQAYARAGSSISSKSYGYLLLKMLTGKEYHIFTEWYWYILRKSLTDNFDSFADNVWLHTRTSYCLANGNGISLKSNIQWYKYCRDVCTSNMVKDRKTIGGPEHVVQIDESLLFKRKNNVGRVISQKKGFLQQILNCSARTLERVILECVSAVSMIHTNQWRSYSNLGLHGARDRQPFWKFRWSHHWRLY